MSAIEELFQRTIDDGAERLSWLQARQGRITASMVGKLLNGGPNQRREILEQSFLPPEEIVGNKYIDRGHEREPVIAAWIQSKWETIAPNVALVHAVGNTRHACTPDGVGTNPQGELVLAEIKTSKYDRDPLGDRFDETGYYEQVQWQMYVTGAVATLFVWEQHDDDWENGPTPLHETPRFRWIRREEAVIARLVETADLALAERDRMAAEQDVEAPEDDEIAQLAAEVLDARIAEAAAKARLKTPWARLLTAVADREEFSAPAGRAQVTWSNRTVAETAPDRDAALAATVDGIGGISAVHGVTGADLFEQYEYAKGLWEEHLAKHMKTVERSVQKLTVTEPKRNAKAKAAAEFDGDF